MTRLFLTIALLVFPLPVLAVEIPVAAGESIQTAIDAANDGDIVVIAAGEYLEALTTEGPGVTLRGVGDPVVRAAGRVLDVQHPGWTLDGLIIDGDYGDRDAVRVGDDGDGLLILNSEVRRSGRDCIDMGDVDGVRIESSVIHHCLQWDGERVDAHGVTGAVVTNFTIVDTDIHTFTGDALQFDPGRSAPGWNDVVIDGCRFWLEPLPATENGVPAGTVPGENAIDTKTNDGAAQASLTIRNTSAWGFRGGLIGNMAAFNIKENVRAHFDGVRVWDSEIAFRLRGATGSRPNGSVTSIHNAVVYDVDTAIRYEDDLQAPIVMRNVTFGESIGRYFQSAGAPDDILDICNLLVVGAAVPDEADGSGNATAGPAEFVDPSAGDYEPLATASFLDSGVTHADVVADIRGVGRPAGDGYDPGAYEWTDGAIPGDMGAANNGVGNNGAANNGILNNGTPIPDAGPEKPDDAGTQTDSGTSAGAAGGCNCRTSSGSATEASWLLLFALFVGTRRRRWRWALAASVVMLGACLTPPTELPPKGDADSQDMERGDANNTRFDLGGDMPVDDAEADTSVDFGPDVGGDFWPRGFQQRTEVTILGQGNLSGTIDDVVIPIRIGGGAATFGANFVVVLGTRALSHEREAWAATRSVLWVRVPSADFQQDNVLHIFHDGNVAAQDSPQDVFKDYQYVFHLEDTRDSVNDFNLSLGQIQGEGLGSLEPGHFAGGFDTGSSGGGDVRTDAMPLAGNVVTVEMWFQPRAGQPWAGFLANIGECAGNGGLRLWADGDDVALLGYASDGVCNQASRVTSTPALGTFHHVVASVDYTNDRSEIYLNGELRGFRDGHTAADLIGATQSVEFGSNRGAGSAFDGVIDEVRIFGTVPDPDRVKATALLSDPSAVVIGATTVGP